MAWFKVDDGFYSHEKVLTIPREVRAEAIGTWTLCGTWSADKERDGFVPSHMIEELGATITGADALATAGLWKRTRNGFTFVNWAEFQPTRAGQDAKRKAESQRKAEWRARKAAERAAVSGNVPTGQNRDDVSPDPTRPDPNTSTTPDGVVARKRATNGTRIPIPFPLTDDMRKWAQTNTPTVPQSEHDRFVDYWVAQPGQKGIKTDWPATWRNWMRTAADRQTTRPTPTQRAAQTMAAGREVAGRHITTLELEAS